MIRLPQDFKEFLESFNARHVEYMIVGSYALAYYGAPRYTGDIDVFIHRTEENARRVIDALKDFGFAFPNLKAEDFFRENNVVQLGVPPVRIDILTFLSGMDWDTAILHAEKAMLDNTPVLVIGKDDFISNKKASGRAKDLADIETIST
jgi:hypothetical protein